MEPQNTDLSAAEILLGLVYAGVIAAAIVILI